MCCGWDAELPEMIRTGTWMIWRDSRMPASVVTVVEQDKTDANYEPLQENLARLREMRDQDGQFARCEVADAGADYFDGQRIPASYANFYIANGIVLVPTFNDPNDRVALNTLADLFPDRRIAGIAAQDLVLGLGTFALHVTAAARAGREVSERGVTRQFNAPLIKIYGVVQEGQVKHENRNSADHEGYELKTQLIPYLRDWGIGGRFGNEQHHAGGLSRLRRSAGKRILSRPRRARNYGVRQRRWRGGGGQQTSRNSRLRLP